MIRGLLKRIRDGICAHVIAIEYPGYGLQKGKPNKLSLNDSLLKVYHFVHSELNCPKQSIFLMGCSIGTGPAVQVACTQQVGGLILLSPFKTIRDVVQHKVGKVAKFFPDTWNSLELMSKISCPVLIIHGQSDVIIPPDHSIELFRARHGNKHTRLHLCEGGHNLSFPRVIKAIKDFFRAEIAAKDMLNNQVMLKIPSYCFLTHSSPSLRKDYSDMSAGTGGNPEYEEMKLFDQECEIDNTLDSSVASGTGGNPEYELNCTATFNFEDQRLASWN
eukprot:CAMPEP_0117746466 /NCGR_PEP_ID=MMETSP0947-20121206/7962_1 /TAXON_ID=44440 /ORGANISM="Chattonella subsalsa, Strain CCMP2191" /LENGTH=274 /DNA_ID=CAMNT_0005563793 /DNA_START=593 /DNA_END=1417 /DNA_ORIENTATION=+